MEFLKSKVVSSGKFIACLCPFCVLAGKTPDTKFHLYIKVGSWCYCYRCGHKGSYEKFREKYSINVDETKLKLNSEVKTDVDQFLKNLYQNTKEFDDSIFSLGGVNYLNKRKVGKDLIERFNLRLGIKDLYGRVVFVDHINNYYVARSIYDNVFPKTLNPVSDVVKPLMYLDYGYEIDTLYIVEGTFDLVPFFRTGRKAIALLGKDISGNQLSQLIKLNIKNFVVSLDSDAYSASVKLCGLLSSNFPLSNVGMYEYLNKEAKDPSDYDVELFNSVKLNWLKVFDSSRVVLI